MKRATIRLAVLALSMPLVAVAVKAQKPAPSQESNHSESDLPASAQSSQNEISKLIQTLMASGSDGKYVNGYAQAIGLDGPMPVKGTMVPIGIGVRRCNIIYEPDGDAGNRPVCLYFVREKKTQHDGEQRSFRVSLDGQLEKVVTLKNKLDDQGKALVEGRSRVEEDMTSPEIQKAFKVEMTFWISGEVMSSSTRERPSTKALPWSSSLFFRVTTFSS